MQRIQPRWPSNESTGAILDADWLAEGTRKPVTDAEQGIIDRALVSYDAGDILYAGGVAGYVRTEYHRQYRMQRFGTQFLHQPPNILRAGDVRGIHYLEWIDHIDHMKRVGFLEEALSLTYECIDAAERVRAIDGLQVGPGWYKRACIILRKLGDADAELRVIEGVLERWPQDAEFTRRLVSVRKLLVARE